MSPRMIVGAVASESWMCRSLRRARAPGPLARLDPLGLIETRDMRRYEIMEIKHGRAAMLGFLHVIALEAGVRVPGYLSTSQNLKFDRRAGGLLRLARGRPDRGLAADHGPHLHAGGRHRLRVQAADR